MRVHSKSWIGALHYTVLHDLSIKHTEIATINGANPNQMQEYKSGNQQVKVPALGHIYNRVTALAGH